MHPSLKVLLFLCAINLLLAACSRNKPAPSLNASTAVHPGGTASPTATVYPLGTTPSTATASLPTYLLTDTAVPYPTPGQSAPDQPYPPPGHRVATLGPSPTHYPTFTLAPTSIPLPTVIPLPTPLPTETPLPVRIVQIRMFDAHTGWAMDSNDNIQRTTNGVHDWKNTTPPVSDGFRCTSASFLDANTAIAGCDHSYLPNSTKYEITTWRTIDGGKTWKSGELVSTDINVMVVDAILMLDSKRGWMYGSGQGSMGHAPISFLNTQDGGMHWKQGYRTTPGNKPELWSYYTSYPFQDDFALVSDTNGFFSNGELYATKDGAQTWAAYTIEPSADYACMNSTGDQRLCKYYEIISAPRFTSSQDGVLIQRVYLKNDYNDSIYHQMPLPQAQYLYFTHDGGQTWTSRLSPAKLGDVYFLNKDTGWFLGKSDLDQTTPTQLYQTSDGGETWSLIAAECPVPLDSELQFANGLTGFAFVNHPAIRYYYYLDVRIYEAVTHAYLYYTQDGGRTWDKIVPQLAP